ncbi:MAG: MBL fold metallo-hydrolase [Gemmatimonadetes bacterium]|nr:MBL fold metallo-hydrolase [Gemmatimonadota bacterium]
MRRALLLSACLFLTVALLPPDLVAQQRDWSAVEIETIPLEDDLFMLVGSGGNIGLSVGDDGAFVVDDQFAPLTEKILAAIGEVTTEPVRWVLNTHWHGDHTGGNENLGEAGAMIVAHKNVYRRMNPAAFSDLVGRSGQAPAKALPVVTFEQGVEFHWNGRDIEVSHVSRAHTDGDAIVHFPWANAFHMGDTFFRDRFPFVDVNSGGGIEGVIDAANFVLARSDESTRIIPGHGPLSTPDDLRRYRDMLETVRLRVSALMAAGRTEDQVLEADPAGDLGPEWGADPEAFIRAVYQSLER